MDKPTFPQEQVIDYDLELSRRVYQLETIQEISLQINANRNIDEILKVVLHSIIGTLGISGGTALLFDNDSRRLSIIAEQNFAVPAEILRLSEDTVAFLGQCDHPIPAGSDESFLRLVEEKATGSTPAYWVALSAGRHFLGAICLGEKLGDKPYSSSDLSFLRTIAAQTAVAIENAKSYTQVKDAEARLLASLQTLETISEGIVNAMAITVEMRDPYTAGHQRRVSQIACIIARELGMAEETTAGLRMAGMIHDIGKLAVPAEILAKPGKITDIEYSLIKTHCEVGYNILKTIEFPWPIAQIIIQHHEYFDGRGYPNGLSKNEILAEARILSVADSIEAIASHRPYRAGLGLDTAIQLVQKARNNEMDPEVVDACVSIYERGEISIESWS